MPYSITLRGMLRVKDLRSTAAAHLKGKAVEETVLRVLARRGVGAKVLSGDIARKVQRVNPLATLRQVSGAISHLSNDGFVKRHSHRRMPC